MLTTGRTHSRPKVRTLQMPKIVVFISKAGVSKLDWTQVFFFSFLVIVFLEEVEKDVKDKAGVKIRFLTRNDSSAANPGLVSVNMTRGGVLAVCSEKTVFLNKHLK